MLCTPRHFLFAVILGWSLAASASELGDARALKDEAMAVLREASARTVEPAVYASAIVKLQKAEELLEIAARSVPEDALPLQREVLAARFWAQRFSTLKVADALNKQRGAPTTERNEPARKEAPPAEQKPQAVAPPAEHKPQTVASPASGSIEETSLRVEQLMQDGKNREAAVLLQQTLEKVPAGGSSAEKTLAVRTKVGDYMYALGLYASAEEHRKFVADAMEKKLGRENPFLVMDLKKLADAYKETGKLDLALGLYNRIISIEEKFYGPAHVEVAKALDDVAEAAIDDNDLNQAEAAIKKGLEIRQKALKPGDMDFALSWRCMGLLKQAQNSYADAEHNYLQALQTYETAYGKEDPRVAGILSRLGAIYSDTGKFPQAESAHTRAVAIREKAAGPEHPSTATTLWGMGNYYRRKGDFAKAEEVIKRALAIREKTLGPEHVLMGAALNLLGVCYIGAGRVNEADENLKRALAIYKKAGKAGERRIPFTANNLGLIVGMRRQYKEANSYFLLAVSILEKNRFPGEGLANTYANVAETYNRQRMFTDALPYAQKSVALCERVLGPNAPALGPALRFYANALRGLGKNAEADKAEARAKAIEAKTKQ